MAHYYTNSDVKSDKKTIFFNILDKKFEFITDNGVFSKARVDFGTELLLKTLINEEIEGKGLDYGCGYGPIGIVISKIKNIYVEMLDVNNRAVELSKENISINKVNCRAFSIEKYDFSNKEYDFVITNPPIRAGKKIIQEIYKNAYNVLKDNGVLYIVIQKKQGLSSTKKFLEEFFTSIETINKQAGFHILKVIK